MYLWKGNIDMCPLWMPLDICRIFFRNICWNSFIDYCRHFFIYSPGISSCISRDFLSNFFKIPAQIIAWVFSINFYKNDQEILLEVPPGFPLTISPAILPRTASWIHLRIYSGFFFRSFLRHFNGYLSGVFPELIPWYFSSMFSLPGEGSTIPPGIPMEIFVIQGLLKNFTRVSIRNSSFHWKPLQRFLREILQKFFGNF